MYLRVTFDGCFNTDSMNLLIADLNSFNIYGVVFNGLCCYLFIHAG